MKHERSLTILTGASLAFFTAWGAAGCLVSAFGLPLARSGMLPMICGGLALLSAVLLSFHHGGKILLCLAALAGGFLHREGTAVRQFGTFLYDISVIYDEVYGVGILILPDKFRSADAFDLPLWILAALIIWAVCRCVCRQKSAWLPVLATILPLCCCIVVTDTVPHAHWLMMVMACLILLVLTASVRHENHSQSLRLTAAAALPVVLALTGLFLAFPQSQYYLDPHGLRENILSGVQNLPRILEQKLRQTASGFQSDPPKQINLAALGTRIPLTTPVLEVTAGQSGTLYLRQQDFDQYDGLGWHSGDQRRESFSGPAGTPEQITLSLLSPQSLQFLPYYPAEEVLLQGGCLEIRDGEDSCQIVRTHLPQDWRQIACREPGTSEEWSHYRTLPDHTRQGAAAFLSSLLPDNASNTEKADLIAALVTDTAQYDLSPSLMPPEEQDFVLWFLRDADRGYCVHFATAATVLLRAADIPSRYVTGYMLEAKANQAVTVTEEHAHAWAEYYEPNLGCWIPLDATPASPSDPAGLPAQATVPETVLPEPPVPEAPSETVSPPTVPDPITTEASPSVPAQPAASEPPDLRPLLAGALLVLFLVAQRSLRLSLRRRNQRKGSTNQQALRRWQEAVLLSRLMKDSPTEELISLAQKAKFSQYEITPEELLEFDSFNRSCLRQLREKPWYLQLIDRYLHAAY